MRPRRWRQGDDAKLPSTVSVVDSKQIERTGSLNITMALQATFQASHQ